MAKYRRKKNQKIKGIGAILTLLLTLGILVTINSYYPISDALPTWQKIEQEFKSYFSDGTPYQGTPDGKLSVHFIDVGQGNCTLIQSPSGTILVDAGENDQGDEVISYLKAQGVTKIDYAVASHPHSDHIGGMDVVLNEIPADYIIMPELKSSIVPTTRTYEDLLNVIEAKQIKVLKANVGDSYEIGGGILKILGPSGDFDDLNNMSVAVKYSYGRRSFFATADMEKKAEKALLQTGEDLSADVFLMGHHGSSTSNTTELLNQVNPEYYVIQAGYGNEYGHPHKEILAEIQKRGKTMYRSDRDGSVIFTTDGESLEVTTTKP